MGADEDGAMAYLVNFDTGAKVDSVLVADGMATFSGTMDEPYVARIIVDGQRYAQFIVEPGSVAYDANRRKAFGSPLNDAYNEITDSAMVMANEFRSIAEADTAARQAVYDRYDRFITAKMEANLDNPISYTLFIQKAYDFDPAELEAYILAHPELGNYQRVTKLVEMNRRKASTGEGARYTDFDVRGQKLSDYVGRDGKWLLVDFWASWCGPCIRETETIKRIYNAYPDTTLEVLGVAVWDEPENTRKAIEAHNLPWGQILNTQNVATDAYGIPAIPCIILFDPEGNIVSRDLMGAELEKAVADALAPAKQ